MPRTARLAPGGMIFHVLNRASARDEIFAKDSDYAAFEKVLLEIQEQVFVRVGGLAGILGEATWTVVNLPLLFSPSSETRIQIVIQSSSNSAIAAIVGSVQEIATPLYPGSGTDLGPRLETFARNAHLHNIDAGVQHVED